MMRRPARRTIRLRIVGAVAGVAAVVLSALAVVVGVQIDQVAVGTAGRLAANDLSPYAVDLVRNPDERPDPPAAGVLVLVTGPDGAVWRDSMPRPLARSARSVRGAADVTVAAGRFRVVERTVSTPRGPWRLWAARDVTAADAVLQGVLLTVVAAVPVAVLATVVVTWLVASAALRPVERLRTAAGRLAAPGATGSLPVRGAAELADLTVTLNALIDDLRRSAAHERRTTADAAHELRTPLAVLAAQVELAERHPATADLHAIRASVDRLGRITDVLLALSRAEAADVDLGAASVAELTTEAMRDIDRFRLLADPGVLVDLELDDALDAGAAVPIDAPAYDRIVTNLVSNALAAGPASSVRVLLRHVDGALVTEVADDGPGVPEEFLPRAFDRFARPEGTRGSAASGAGLGLALVQRLAERAGGSATLENRPGGGALATVVLPLEGGRADPGGGR